MKYLLNESFYNPKKKGVSSFELHPKRVRVMLNGIFTPQELRAMADAVEQGLDVPKNWKLNNDGQYEIVC